MSKEIVLKKTVFRKFTIHDIKRLSDEAERKFFDPKTLKFFGQRVKDFKVKHIGNRVFIWAPRKPGGKFSGYTVAEFDKNTAALNSMPGFMFDSLNTIEQFWEMIQMNPEGKI